MLAPCPAHLVVANALEGKEGTAPLHSPSCKAIEPLLFPGRNQVDSKFPQACCVCLSFCPVGVSLSHWGWGEKLGEAATATRPAFAQRVRRGQEKAPSQNGECNP